MSRILVVEDELHLADGLRFNLEAEGYDTEVQPFGWSSSLASRIGMSGLLCGCLPSFMRINYG